MLSLSVSILGSVPNSRVDTVYTSEAEQKVAEIYILVIVVEIFGMEHFFPFTPPAGLV